MTEIAAGVAGAAARAAAHAKELREGGAPHQQALAADLTLLAEHAGAATTMSQKRQDDLAAAEQMAQDKLRTMQQNVDHVLDQRDLAKKELADKGKEHEREIEALRQDHAAALASARAEVAELERANAALVEDLAKLESERNTLLNDQTKLGVASTKGETGASLKAKTKK